MSTVVSLVFGSLTLGSLYFLLASGLTLSFGLMRVVNFAHGAFLTLGAYAAYWIMSLGAHGPVGYLLATVFAIVVGGLLAVVVELTFIRRLYNRVVVQLLVTLGLGYVILSLLSGLLTDSPRRFAPSGWLQDVLQIDGANVPVGWLIITGVGIVILGLLMFFLHSTRHGLIIRAAVENSSMVTALGIDVRRSFLLVFGLGGALAGLAGSLSGLYYGSVYPSLGQDLLIFSFVVVVMGGTGSVPGCALAAIIVSVCQQFVNYYVGHGTGDFVVVVLLAVVLLTRSQGLLGRKTVL